MKLRTLATAAMTSLLLLATGCSTTSYFKVPPNSSLTVDGRMVNPRITDGAVKTRPFFWSKTGGIPFTLHDGSGKVVRQGTLKSGFRVGSIFWPPMAIIYWPLRFGAEQYDLTREADGQIVRDLPSPLATPSTAKR
jgi:hypothetical protein